MSVYCGSCVKTSAGNCGIGKNYDPEGLQCPNCNQQYCRKCGTSSIPAATDGFVTCVCGVENGFSKGVWVEFRHNKACPSHNLPLNRTGGQWTTIDPANPVMTVAPPTRYWCRREDCETLTGPNCPHCLPNTIVGTVPNSLKTGPKTFHCVVCGRPS